MHYLFTIRRISYTFFLILLCISRVSASSDLGLRAATAVMGESVVVDKETGRIFWEGGSSSTLSESLAPKLKIIIGIPHCKATILTMLLLFAAAGTIAETLRHLLNGILGEAPRPYLQAAILSFVRAMLLLPKLPRWLVFVTTILYFTEAYTCSTRQYLAHAVFDVEAYIEQLRESPPIVEWKVRSFHYENAFLSTVRKLLRRSEKRPLPMSSYCILRWKRVTRTAKFYYKFSYCMDQTFAGVWKRAVVQKRRVPITKIVLTKTLLLRNAKARQDYFTQQRAFLAAQHGDDFAEFSTSVQVSGFEPRVLSVPLSSTGVKPFLLQEAVFWICTAVGLTVPYRRWLAAHCDEVRLRVIKETGTDDGIQNASRGWFSFASSKPAESSTFRSTMQRLSTPSPGELLHNVTAALLEEGLEAASILALADSNETASTDGAVPNGTKAVHKRTK